MPPASKAYQDGIHPGGEGHRFIADSIIRQLWPLLKLPGSPKLPNDDALAILRRRSEILKLAWLTQTRHIRPGVPTGLPLDQANGQAAELMKSYLEAEVTLADDSRKADIRFVAQIYDKKSRDSYYVKTSNSAYVLRSLAKAHS